MPSLEQWQAMWRRLGVETADETLYHALSGRYTEPHRHYHTLQHLDECFAWMPAVTLLAVHPHEIELALWFHDAIYDVKRQDNEEKCAAWAKSVAAQAGLSQNAGERIYELVMVTRHSAVPVTNDTRTLVDIDLSILGAMAERFDEYERQVREEYAWVPGLLFRRKRRQILEAFVARPRIFNTDYFFERLEHTARANLARSIAKLGG
jgi:predicted metal-dependent HD superfamily phosphohydrolase